MKSFFLTKNPRLGEVVKSVLIFLPTQFYNVLKFDKFVFVHLSSAEAKLIGCFCESYAMHTF